MHTLVEKNANYKPHVIGNLAFSMLIHLCIYETPVHIWKSISKF